MVGGLFQGRDSLAHRDMIADGPKYDRLRSSVLDVIRVCMFYILLYEKNNSMLTANKEWAIMNYQHKGD